MSVNFNKQTLEQLLNKYPELYSKITNSNWGKLNDIFLDQLNKLKQLNEDINKNKNINNSYGKNLDKHGKNLNQLRGELSDELYRALIKARLRANLSSGDTNSLIEFIATAFQLEREDIKISQPWQGSFKFADNDGDFNEFGNGFDVGTLRSSNYEPASFIIEINSEKINNIGIEAGNILDVINLIKAAGINATLSVLGTFSFADNNGDFNDFGNGFDVGTLGLYRSGDEEILPEI